MATISLPKVSITLTSAQTDSDNTPKKVLLLGQQNGGTATSNTLVTNITSTSAANTLFGTRSMLATMFRAAKTYDDQNLVTVDCIPLDDVDSGSGGVAATGAIAFSGTATESGTMVIYIQSRTLDYKLSLNIVVGDAASDIASSLASTLSSNSYTLCVAEADTGTVTLTCTHTGTVGNDLFIYIDAIPSGITTTITAFTGGSGDPDLTDIFDLVEDQRYHRIIYPYMGQVDILQTYVDSLWNTDSGDILDGVGIVGATDTLANFTDPDGAYALNSNCINVIANKPITTTTTTAGGAIGELNAVLQTLAGMRYAKFLTDNASLTSNLANTSIGDLYGGTYRAPFPYFNSVFPSLPTILNYLGWTKSEQNTLTTAGISYYGNNSSNTYLIMGQQVTTYLTDSDGNSDSTWHFLNSVDTASNVREYFQNNVKSRYAQAELTTGYAPPGILMASTDSIKSYLFTLYKELATTYGLTVYSSDAYNAFSTNSTVTISDAEAGIVNCTVPAYIVSQLRAIYVTIAISFSVG